MCPLHTTVTGRMSGRVKALPYITLSSPTGDVYNTLSMLKTYNAASMLLPLHTTVTGRMSGRVKTLPYNRRI